jgi:hypothetical protein
LALATATSSKSARNTPIVSMVQALKAKHHPTPVVSINLNSCLCSFSTNPLWFFICQHYVQKSNAKLQLQV